MCAQVNRAMLKKLVSEGIAPGEPLVAPQVFSQAAQIENIPLDKFVGNETKIPLALEKLQGHLKSGCIFSTIANDLSDNMLKVGLETCNRLRKRFRDSLIIGLVLPGPYTAGSGQEGITGSDALDAGAERLTHVVRAYCEKDPDLVIIREEEIPIDSPEFWSQWYDVMESIGNILTYYNVLPIVMVSNGSVREIAQVLKDCPSFVPAFPLVNVPVLQEQGVLDQKPWVLALDFDLDSESDFLDRQLEQARVFKDTISVEGRRNLVMITTDREIPHTVSVSKLPELVHQMKSLVL